MAIPVILACIVLTAWQWRVVAGLVCLMYCVLSYRPRPTDWTGSSDAIVGLAAVLKALSQSVGMVGTTSAGFSISVSSWNSTSGRISTPGIAAEIRPPCTCDLRIMVDVVGRTCRYGRRNKLTGRRYGNRLIRHCDRYTLERFPWFSSNYTVK